MKRIFAILFPLLSYNCNAQYFEQNGVFASNVFADQHIGYIDFAVGHDGTRIVRINNDPCLPCDPEISECIIDPDGNASCYNMYLNYYRHSYFDKRGNILQINENDSGYALTAPGFTKQVSTGFVMHVDSDSSLKSYVFEYSSADSSIVSVFDTTGSLLFTQLVPGNRFLVSGAGSIFAAKQGGDLLLMDDSFNVVHQYAYDGLPLDISYNGNMFWIRNGNDIVCSDTSGVILYTIPVNAGRLSLAHSGNDTVYFWNGDNIYKYHSGSLIWSVAVDAALTESIGVSCNGEIHYIANYEEPLYDEGNFIPSSYNVPPSVAFNGYTSEPDPFPGITSYVITGKINPAYADTFSIYLNSINAGSSICTENKFDVSIGFSCMPFAHVNDTFLIEISDTLGSFAQATTIGSAQKMIIECNISNSFPAGSGYLIRARTADSLIISDAFPFSFEVIQSPQANIYLDNSIYGNRACPPMMVIAAEDSGFSYSWYSIYDPFGEPWFDYFPDDTSVLTISDFYEGIGVTITDNATGCSVNSNRIYYVDPIDTAFFTGYSFSLPDSVKRNDAPFDIYISETDSLEGPGIYTHPFLDYHYTFIPDSAGPGSHAVTLTIPHAGTPCVPWQYVQTVYVDSSLNNIVTGEVEPSDHSLCEGDSFSVPFTLIDSTVYDSTNIFYVEAGYLDSDFNFYTLAIAGSGNSSPVTCIAPSLNNGSVRFRVTSSKTNEPGTLNPNGDITLYSKPVLLPYLNFNSTACFRDTIQFSFYNADSASLYYNDTLIVTQSGNPFNYDPGHNGFYSVVLHGACSASFDSIEVNGASSVPSLGWVVTNDQLCGHQPMLLAVSTDSSSYLQWYQDEVAIPETDDSIYINTSGLYSVTATDSSGCAITVIEHLFVFANPLIHIYPDDSIALCPGQSVELSTYNDFNYSYQWVMNDSVLLLDQYNQSVTDTGTYYVVVTTDTGCTDTSATIVVYTKVLAPPLIYPGSTVHIPYQGSAMLSTDSVAGYMYQWYRNAQEISGAMQWQYEVDKPGFYTVEITDAEGCMAVSDVTVVKQRIRYHGHIYSTERMMESPQPEYTVYPNPSTGAFTITGVNAGSGKIRTIVYDVFGRVVRILNQYPVDGSVEIVCNLEDAASGLYNVRIEGVDYSLSLPVLLNH